MTKLEAKIAAIWRRIAFSIVGEPCDYIRGYEDGQFEARAELARLRRIEEAAREHGRCTCRYYPGYPRGERHAPECDHDPDLLVALTALTEPEPTLPFRDIGYTTEECERDMRRLTNGKRGCTNPDDHLRTPTINHD
jgi:hypothetical protein